MFRCIPTASAKPVSWETLGRLVGDACRLDDLLADINEELKGRPYEIAFVAGGWQFRTRPRHAEALRSLAGTRDGPPPFTKLEMLALSAIAYQQPVTRLELSRFARRYVSAGSRLISPANARRIDRLGDDRPLRNLRARQPARSPRSRRARRDERQRERNR